MAVAVDAAVGAGTPTDGSFLASLTWSHTVAGANRCLLVTIGYAYTTLTIGTVTYGGVALTRINGWDSGTSAQDRHIELWRLTAPAAGTANIVVTVASSGSWYLGCASYSLTGVDQTTPLGTAVSDTGGAAASSAVVSSAVGGLVIGACNPRGSATPTATGTAQTRDVSVAFGTATQFLGASHQDGASSVTSSWSWALSDRYAAFAVPVNAAAASTPAPHRPATVVSRAVTRAAVI